MNETLKEESSVETDSVRKNTAQYFFFTLKM